MRAEADAFQVVNGLDAFEGAARVFARTWPKRIQRDFV